MSLNHSPRHKRERENLDPKKCKTCFRSSPVKILHPDANKSHPILQVSIKTIKKREVKLVLTFDIKKIFIRSCLVALTFIFHSLGSPKNFNFIRSKCSESNKNKKWFIEIDERDIFNGTFIVETGVYE